MKNLFSVLHFNIKIIIVFMGKRPLQKRFSYIIDDESEYRMRSIVLRSKITNNNTDNNNNIDIEENKNENLNTEIKLPIPDQYDKKYYQKIINIKNPNDPNLFSIEQVEKFAANNVIIQNRKVVHSDISSPFIFYENQPKTNHSSTVSSPSKKPEFKSILPIEQEIKYNSKLLDDIEDIINDDIDTDTKIDNDNKNVNNISLIPAENPYFPPTENYVTAEHVRVLINLLNILDIPYIMAPEEACAECARLENEGIVDAVASDDNNAILFGSKWLIRGIFLRPQSITLSSLEEIGLTRERLLNISMMIDGDYNSDIRKRLFTVGPVRGLEIISFFPDKINGLKQFKEWFKRVIKNKEKETDQDLINLSKKKWIRKLIVPANFPPADLYEAFCSPNVSNTNIIIKPLKVNEEELIQFIMHNSSSPSTIINEYVQSFIKRIKTFNNSNETLHFQRTNKVEIPDKFVKYIDRIRKYDSLHKQKSHF